MEDNRAINFFVVTLLVMTFLAAPVFSSAYDDKTTHPALTQEIVKFFNRYFPGLALNDAERMLIMQGSIDEDDGVRFMHHFYDPVFNRGLTFGNSSTNPQLAAIGSAARLQQTRSISTLRPPRSMCAGLQSRSWS